MSVRPADRLEGLGSPLVVLHPVEEGRAEREQDRRLAPRRAIVLQSDDPARRSFCYLADATLGFFTALLKGHAAEVLEAVKAL